jgi:hypothetical protein
VRVLFKGGEGVNDLMVVVAGQITVSQPSDHAHTWKFFEDDYVGWQGGYNTIKVDTKFVLAWFTPHTTPDLDDFGFVNQAMEGTTINVAFSSFTGILGEVFSSLCNRDNFKPCACTQFCTNRCGCRKAGIPCRTMQLDKTPLPGQLNQRCYSFGRCYQSLGAAK